MEFITNFYLFILSVVLVSLSGVMSPGPLFAVTIKKASEDKKAGVLISFGHGVVEFPLMFLIYFGLVSLLASSLAQRVIGFVGGFILIYMGVGMLRTLKHEKEETSSSKYGSVASGILATGANPYFLLWWATIGAALVLNAAFFGLAGFLIFAAVHWLCDLLWNTLVSVTVFRSQRFWTRRVNQAVFGFCFAVLVGFGAWFVLSAFF